MFVILCKPLYVPSFGDTYDQNTMFKSLCNNPDIIEVNNQFDKYVQLHCIADKVTALKVANSLCVPARRPISSGLVAYVVQIEFDDSCTATSEINPAAIYNAYIDANFEPTMREGRYRSDINLQVQAKLILPGLIARDNIKGIFFPEEALRGNSKLHDVSFEGQPSSKMRCVIL